MANDTEKTPQYPLAERDNLQHLLDQRPIRPTFIVGLDLYMDLLVNNNKVRCKATVHGWVDNQFFMTSSPTLNGQEVQIKPNEVITVRFILDGVVYGFNSMMLRRVLGPVNLWFLAYPNIIETITLRKHSRLPMLIPVTINGEQHKGLILDLSLGGALIDCLTMCESMPGSIELAFALPNGTEVKALRAEVKNVRSYETSRQLGVRFADANAAAIDAVRQFIEQLPSDKISQRKEAV
jgi:c-di-GMP-binding flagellar brake protein YcgR